MWVRYAPSGESELNKVTYTKTTGKSTIARGCVVIALLLLCLCALIYRLADLQLIDAEKNRNAAIDQYTSEITIYAKRGSIYDRNMKVLATSSTVQTVFISPYDIVDDEQAELIANGLARILGASKEDVLERAGRKYSKYQIIKKNVEEAEETALREFIEKNDLYRQVCLEESTKRYYPYSTLACHTLGFVGGENTGLYGIERTYEKVLGGINGKAIQGQDGQGNELPFQYESYIDSEDGQSAVLTLDYTIQSILTKYLMDAVEEHKPTFGARGIIMQVDTGEILGMASIGEFDLNAYGHLTGEYLDKYEAFNGTDEEKRDYENELLFEMWKNKVATELYEPGSTFKIITTAIGIEEGVFTLNSKYTCKGAYTVLGVPIHCHTGNVHGEQTVAEALVNSCNPAFVQMGLDIGGDLFMKYFDAFGYTDKTGSDVLGEARSIYYESLANQLDLANCAFGQSMSITMLQHIAAVSCVANGGYLTTPHLIKGYVDSNGNYTESTEYSAKRAVISAATAKDVLGALKNSTKNASVSGYNISSKTGTSQKLGRKDAKPDEEYYIASCVSFAPAEDPEIAILIVVDEPTGGKYYGSQCAAPVVANVLSEVLPYLEIYPTNDGALKEYKVSDYITADVDRAKYDIESKGLKCVVKGSGNKVVDQLPRVGTTVSEKGTVILYTESYSEKSKVKIRNLNKMSPEQVFRWITDNNLNVIVEGVYNKEYDNCFVLSQSIDPGTEVTEGTVMEVTFIYEEDIE